MKERPILFSAAMVQAIIAGRKSQTRRVIKPQPDHCHRDIIGKPKPWNEADYSRLLPQFGEKQIECPYGTPGDRLWLKETWSKWDDGGRQIVYRADLRRFWAATNAAGEWEVADAGYNLSSDSSVTWKSSMFMPRWASRITLEITNVRVQRLQEISEEDAIAEGIESIPNSEGPNFFSYRNDVGWHNAPTARECYADLWDSINAKAHPWAANEWVWALTFRKVEAR